MQPNYTKEGLFHSERVPVFPDHDKSWKFDPNATEFSLVNAWWLCNLSHLAYYDEVDAKPIIKKMGFTLEAFADDRKMEDSEGKVLKDTQAYILSTEDFVVLAFRGSEPDIYKDYLTDLYLKPTAFPDKGMVHGGFFAALKGQIWDKIQQTLRSEKLKNKPLWITGHSLGAAMSTIASAHLEPHGLYNFGSPRVGDSTFQASFEGKNVHRFANCSDLVTHLLPKDLLDFQHIGTLHYFDADSNHSISPTDKFMDHDQLKARILYPLRELVIPFLSEKLFFRSFADHNVINYSYGIWKTLHK